MEKNPSPSGSITIGLSSACRTQIKYMNSLELFSGSGIVSTILHSKGFNTYTLDINKKLKPKLCCNILDFPYKDLPSTFDFIWASPDCSLFSRANPDKHFHKEIIKYRRYKYTPLTQRAKNSLRLVEKTVEIINHYRPLAYFIENPVGRIRHLQVLLHHIPYRYCVNYKQWGFDYSKETDIFTNVLLPLPTKKIVLPGRGVNDISGTFERSKIPPALINFLIDHSPIHQPTG